MANSKANRPLLTQNRCDPQNMHTNAKETKNALTSLCKFKILKIYRK